LVFAIGERKNKKILPQILILISYDICSTNAPKYLLLMEHFELILRIASSRSAAIQFQCVGSAKQHLSGSVVFLSGFYGIEVDG